MKPIQSHKDLVVWQKAVSLAGKVYAATRLLPADEHYGLVSQLRRAAVSIPSNIAEGAARHNRTEFLHFLQIARGSLAELETQIMIAAGQDLLANADNTLDQIGEVGRLLNGLIRSLSSSGRDAHAVACSPSGSSSQNQPLTANR